MIEDVGAEEDCDSDSDSMSDIDARKMFSNRSIKDLSLGNFQKFKLLNQDSQIRCHFSSETTRIEPVRLHRHALSK